MKVLKSYKFRIMNPSQIIKSRLETTLNLCRELYNNAIQERRNAYGECRISLNYFDQEKQLKDIKVTNPEYRDIHSQILQEVLRRVEKTFKLFFQRIKQGKAGFPRFKGRDRYDSFTFPQSGFSLTGNKLTLSKIGTVKLKLSRSFIGKVKTLTIKSECGNWFAIFAVEIEIELLPKTGLEIGIDAGVESFITLSDGSKIENYKYFESSQKKLRVLQRSVAHKKKGSNNRRKAVLRVRKLHQKIKNRRLDFHHKISTWLIKTFDLIAIERLSLLGLSKGILAKQFHDVGIGSFFEKLKYKAVNAGKKVVEINPAYTSQDCSNCGYREKKELRERWNNCQNCNLQLHRDHNAAINILRLGQASEMLPLERVNHSNITYQVTESVFEESPVL